jgi:RNA polymerase sigma-70 factor (ECF subfamily)
VNGDNTADSEIIARLHRRDADGLAAAYDRYGRTVYALFVRITRDPAVAEDLTQELFLRLWNRSREFDPQRGALGVWLLSMARNLAIDHVRSAHSRFATRLRPMDHVDTLSFSSNPSVSESRIHDERTIRQAFNALNAAEKRVMELAYFEGFSQSEIAEKLHEPLGTIKSRMRSALGRLRLAISGPGTMGAAHP